MAECTYCCRCTECCYVLYDYLDQCSQCNSKNEEHRYEHHLADLLEIHSCCSKSKYGEKLVRRSEKRPDLSLAAILWQSGNLKPSEIYNDTSSVGDEYRIYHILSIPNGMIYSLPDEGI